MELIKSIIAALDEILILLAVLLSILLYLIFSSNRPFNPAHLIILIGYVMIFYDSMGRKVSIAILDFTNLKNSLNKIKEFLLINDDLDDKSTYEISNDDSDLAIRIDQLKYFKGYKAYLDSINLNIKNGILIKQLQSINSFI